MVSKDRILELFEVDIKNGILIRKKWRGKGKRAGYISSNGYRVLNIDRKDYFEHNVLWFVITGKWPELYVNEIDHINGVKDDNRFENLRLATRSQNLVNRVLSNNTSGCANVQYDPRRRKYAVNMSINKKRKFLGRFDTFEEAVKVANETRSLVYGEFSR